MRNNRSRSQEQVVKLLTHYLSMRGADWDSDSDAEVETLVEHIHDMIDWQVEDEIDNIIDQRSLQDDIDVQRAIDETLDDGEFEKQVIDIMRGHFREITFWQRLRLVLTGRMGNSAHK